MHAPINLDDELERRREKFTMKRPMTTWRLRATPSLLPRSACQSFASEGVGF
jgi:hypothetical protein